MDFFRRLFGFPDQRHDSQSRLHSQQPQPPNPPFPEDHGRLFGEDDFTCQRIDPHDGHQGMSFNIFSDPLEMHRYFEQQMDNIFKHFGMPNLKNFFHAIEPPDMDKDIFRGNAHEELPQDSREHFLKKGYEKPLYEYPHVGEKVDKDVDGKLSLTDIDKLFRSSSDNQTNVPNENQSLRPYGGLRPYRGTFFNQSVQVKTIRKPDGSFETHRTVTDSEGNQETTITQKSGDKEYTVVKKRDREGKEEIHETFINMTEEEKSLFDKAASPRTQFDDNSLYSKFFK